MIDLHIHTNASSDGQHTPQEIFGMARNAGLKAIAFADHNTVGSLEEGSRLSGEFGIEFVPAIELNTIFDELDLHLLGYYVNYKDPDFIAWLADINRKKVEQALKRFEKLKELGFIFNFEDIERFAKGKIPSGTSFLKAILSRKENAGDPRLRPYIDGDRSNSPYLNFYLDYLRGGKPASVPIKSCDTISSIKMVKKFGGVPILAHPTDTPIIIIERLIKEGLAGLEAYSSRHTIEECEHFRKLADKYGILYTAGSDFHGKQIKPNVEMGCIKRNGYELLQRLKEYRRK